MSNTCLQWCAENGANRKGGASYLKASSSVKRGTLNYANVNRTITCSLFAPTAKQL